MLKRRAAAAAAVAAAAAAAAAAGPAAGPEQAPVFRKQLPSVAAPRSCRKRCAALPPSDEGPGGGGPRKAARGARQVLEPGAAGAVVEQERRREQDAIYDRTRELLSFVPHDLADGVARLRAGKSAKPAKPARAGAPDRNAFPAARARDAYFLQHAQALGRVMWHGRPRVAPLSLVDVQTPFFDFSCTCTIKPTGRTG